MLIVITILLFSFLMFYLSYSISAGVYVKSLCRNKDARGVIAITFDDGVDAIQTPKVLEVLNRYNAKATFFIIGERANLYPNIVKMIVEQGHDIGNHSYYHKGGFPSQSTKSMLEEVEMCSELLEEISGREIRFFRPPFGVTNPTVAKVLNIRTLTSIGWSIRSLDTLGQKSSVVAKRVNKRVKEGEVILLHDNRANSEVLLEQILENIKVKGLKPVTITELFNL